MVKRWKNSLLMAFLFFGVGIQILLKYEIENIGRVILKMDAKVETKVVAVSRARMKLIN